MEEFERFRKYNTAISVINKVGMIVNYIIRSMRTVSPVH